MRKALSAAFVVLLSIFTANAQYVRSIFDASDIVIVGQVQWVADSEQGYFHTVGSTSRTAVAVREVRLRVLAVIKGTATSSVSIALPKSFTWYDEPMRPGTPTVYDVRQNQKAIWFLRRAVDGDFTEDLRSLVGAYPRMWKAPGLQLSVSELQGPHPSAIPVSRTEVSGHECPILKLADLFAANAAVGTAEADFYLAYLADLTPEPLKTIGYGKDLAGAEVAEHMAWLINRFPVLFPEDVAWRRLSAMAVKMQWGQEELSAAFTDLYISAGPSALHGRFPQIARNQDAIRLISVVPSNLAGALIRGLKRDRADRSEITRRAVRRFGEDHYLDGNILEALWKLWDMPELSPFAGNGSLLDDLSAKIALARRLVP
jgi:hypothetical protein